MSVSKLSDLSKTEYRSYMKMAAEQPGCVKTYMGKLIVDADANWETETTRDRFYHRAASIINACKTEFRHRAVARDGKTL